MNIFGVVGSLSGTTGLNASSLKSKTFNSLPNSTNNPVPGLVVGFYTTGEFNVSWKHYYGGGSARVTMDVGGVEYYSYGSISGASADSPLSHLIFLGESITSGHMMDPNNPDRVYGDTARDPVTYDGPSGSIISSSDPDSGSDGWITISKIIPTLTISNYGNTWSVGASASTSTGGYRKPYNITTTPRSVSTIIYYV